MIDQSDLGFRNYFTDKFRLPSPEIPETDP